jgi:hypothetical protein
LLSTLPLQMIMQRHRKKGILPFRGQKVPEYGCQLFSKTARLGDRFELPVDVLGVALLANADSAHDDHAMFRMNAENDAVVSELVLPIARERAAQRQSVPFRANGQPFLQSFSELIPYASVESLNIRCGVRRVSKFKGRFGARLFCRWS